MSNKTNASQQEREILEVMRKVLAQVVVDTTPENTAFKHPLNDRTIRNIKRAFALIATRERQLSSAIGEKEQYPHFTDEKKSPIVSIDSLKRES